MHRLTRTGSGRAARSPGGPCPQRSEGTAGPSVRSRAVGSVRLARRLPHRPPQTRGLSCERGVRGHSPSVGLWRTCIHIMYTHPALNLCAEVCESALDDRSTGESTYGNGPCGLPIMASTPAPSLWRHRDFLLLWLGQSVSRLGDQFTGLAIPVIAVYVLAAGPLEMGFLGFASTLPFLLFGLLVGGWVDRRQRRSVLIRADLGRGVVIAAIAALSPVRLLHMAYLYVFSFLIGILTVFFDVAYQAYLPALVDRKQLVDANSKLETSNSAANTGGPALAGAVIELFKAPIAMVFDAASFFFSAATLVAIRKREPTPDPGQRRSVLIENRG